MGIGTAALLLYLALERGGYDLILRQQLGAGIWWFLALAVAFGVLPRARLSREQRWAVGAFAALILWIAVGMLDTESAGRTFEELGLMVTYAGLIALGWATLTPGTWRDAAAGLAVAALVVPAVAVASRLVPDLFDAIGAPELIGGERLAYPLGYWNAVAAWSAMAFCIGLAWSAHARRSVVRELALAALPVAGLALYLTYSRGGAGALLVGLAVTVVLARNRLTVAGHASAALAATAAVVLVARGQPEIADGAGGDGGWLVAVAVLGASLACSQASRLTRALRLDRRSIRDLPGRRAAGIVAGAAVIGVILVAGAGVSVRGGGDAVGDGSPEIADDPAARLVGLEGTRDEIWASAARALGSEPITGLGAGSFQFWWQRDVAAGEELRDAHSLYLEVAAELGAPGLVLVVAFLGAVLVGAFRGHGEGSRMGDAAATTGLLAAYAAFLFHAGIDWLWEFPALVALGLGAGMIGAGSRSTPVRRRSRLNRGRLAFVLVAVLAGVVQIPAAVSESGVRSAEDALLVGQTERARDLAGDAITAEPWAAEPYAVRAFVSLADGRPGRALSDIRAAIEREPTNWRHRLLLARAEAELGNRSRAIAATFAAERLRPGLGGELRELREAIRSGELTPPE